MYIKGMAKDCLPNLVIMLTDVHTMTSNANIFNQIVHSATVYNYKPVAMA